MNECNVPVNTVHKLGSECQQHVQLLSLPNHNVGSVCPNLDYPIVGKELLIEIISKPSLKTLLSKVLKLLKRHQRDSVFFPSTDAQICKSLDRLENLLEIQHWCYKVTKNILAICSPCLASLECYNLKAAKNMYSFEIYIYIYSF